jgi:hypothetical protein
VFLWFLDGSSSNWEGNFGGQISSPSDVPGSGESSMAESKDVEGKGFDSTARRSLWLNLRVGISQYHYQNC